MNLEQIKNEVAVKHGFENFEQIIDCIYVNSNGAGSIMEDIIDEVAAEHARQMCDEQIKACAKNADAGYDHIEECPFVDTQSILNTPNVVTTKP